DAGSLTYQQACARVVGQSIGTAATSGLAALGGGLAVRRTALAHVTFSVIVGVLATLFLGPLTAAAECVGARLHDPDGVLALAAFSSIFKLAGILVFYPWLDHFVRLIERISGSGGESAISPLDPTGARPGGAVALQAARAAALGGGVGATREVARGAVDAIRGRLAGASVRYVVPAEATQQIERFLGSISLDTIDPSGMEPRLVRLCHALDHLTALQDDLTRVPLVASG